MDKATVLKIVKELPFDTQTTIFKQGNCEIYLWRPSKVSSRFKNYDINRNFQIWLNEGDKKFRGAYYVLDEKTAEKLKAKQ